MRKLILAFCIMLTGLTGAIGQRSESEIALREYFIDAEFFLAQEYYLDALNDYLQVYRRGYEDNANINYRIGICYLNIPGQKHKSIDYLKKSLVGVSDKYKQSSLKETYAPLDAHLFLGNAYRVNNMLDSAIASYNTYKGLLPEKEEELHAYANQQIEACVMASSFMEKPAPMFLKNMGEQVNGNNDDYRGVLSGDGNTLLYMHRLPFYDAVFYTKKEDGAWQEPVNITPQIISDGDQFICAVSYDGNTILLAREDEYNSDIYISTFEDGEWTPSIALGGDVNTKYWESHASFSKDMQTIYFTSNRAGGVGGMDIYKASRNARGDYEEVVNVKEVNTPFNEDAPFLTDDGTKLYFSSQGFVNMGGYDVFVSEIGEEGALGVPQNLEYPINTTDDDVFYYPVDNGETALMSRIEEDGYGIQDIYHVHFTEPPKDEPLVATAEKAIEEVVPVVEVKEEEIIAVEGKETEKVVIEEPAKEKVEEKVLAAEPAEMERELVEVPPLLFEFDKSALTVRGERVLKRIIVVMENHPEAMVELFGFADPLGPESYNLALSTRRAQTVLDYLVSKGANPEQIKATGKGETEFIARNTRNDGSDSPEGRYYNRRVEFEIYGVDTLEVKIMREDIVPPELKIKQ